MKKKFSLLSQKTKKEYRKKILKNKNITLSKSVSRLWDLAKRLEHRNIKN